jgi:adenosylhomocysteine nucleosidase
MNFFHVIGLFDIDQELKQISCMQLLTFAHRPEAQAFFDAFSFKSTTTDGLYRSEFGWLLITGEGIHESIVTVASILGAHPEITEIINLGVAGSLKPALERHTIYEVRTAFAFDEVPLFKSFPLSGEVDCVTSGKRVLSPSQRIPLLAMGSVVDRELWGVCVAAKQHHKNVRSFKYISDDAGELGACEVVKELARDASVALLERYRALQPQAQSSELKLAGFYFTVSQEHLLKNFLHKLSIKWELSPDEILRKLNVESLSQQKLLPKERTKRLLDILKKSLDPWGSEFEGKMHELFQALHPINVTSATHFQTPELKLSCRLQSQEELEQILSRLESFDWGTYFRQYRVSDV